MRPGVVPGARRGATKGSAPCHPDLLWPSCVGAEFGRLAASGVVRASREKAEISRGRRSPSVLDGPQHVWTGQDRRRPGGGLGPESVDYRCSGGPRRCPSDSRQPRRARGSPTPARPQAQRAARRPGSTDAAKKDLTPFRQTPFSTCVLPCGAYCPAGQDRPRASGSPSPPMTATHTGATAGEPGCSPPSTTLRPQSDSQTPAYMVDVLVMDPPVG